MSRSLLLLSSSRHGDQPFLAHAREALVEHLAGVREAIFVPYAGVTVTPAAYAARVIPTFAALGVRIRSLPDEPNARAALASAEAVVVGGGNTFRLLERLQRLELLAPLRAVAGAGRPYVGWSAGAVLAGPSIATTNDMPIVEPAGFGALALVAFHLNAHFTDAHPPGFRGETRRERLAEFLAIDARRRVAALPEGTWLSVADGAIHVAGADAALCFEASGVQTLPPGARADPVLEPDGPPRP